MAKKKSVKGKPWVSDPRLSCLGEFCIGDQKSDTRYEDVHDVDIMQTAEDSKFPYRTRLCSRCRKGVDVRFDRGDVNAGK